MSGFGRRPNDDFSADIAAGAGPIFDDELLSEPLRQRLTDDTRDDVGRNSSRESDDDPHRPCRVGLRPDTAPSERQGESDRGQMKEFAAAKVHECAPTR